MFTIKSWLEFIQFSSVQSLSHVQLFATSWITAHQASLSITNSQSLLKLMSIESVMPCNHLIFCHSLLFLPQSLPASGSFPMSELFAWGGQRIGVSALASVLPMNTQDWSLLGWTDWIYLQSKWLLRVFSNTTVQKHQLSSLHACMHAKSLQSCPTLCDPMYSSPRTMLIIWSISNSEFNISSVFFIWNNHFYIKYFNCNITNI